MAGIEELTRRVAQLEARAEIGALIAGYGLACDEQDMATLMSLFTRDAYVGSKDGQLMRAQGHAEIDAMFRRLFSFRGPSYHWTHDHVCTTDPANPDRATGRVMAHAETTPNGTTSLAALRYDDVYRREDGRWRFERRILSFLYYLPTQEYLAALPDPLRMRIQGDRRPADFPEGLPTWKTGNAARPP